jgi:hypothetical protein
MNLRFAYLFLASLFFLTLLLIGCGDSITPTTNGFRVHEWGVLVGCQSDQEFFLTSRPEFDAMVREPVIYIYMEEKEPFSCRINFANGNPLLTYPEAELGSSTVEWKNVQVLEENAYKSNILSDFKPLERIIDVLNNVDADLLLYNDTYSRFLFYEGNVVFQNNITVEYDHVTSTASIQNTGSYTVYNVVLSARSGYQAPVPQPIHVSVDSLLPWETRELALSIGTPPSWNDEFESLGFTSMEAQSFSTLWSESFLYPDYKTVINLIYRLPQDVYNYMIQVTFEPQPEAFIRTLYVKIHIEVEDILNL